jgi:GTP-binding protein HflX
LTNPIKNPEINSSRQQSGRAAARQAAGRGERTILVHIDAAQGRDPGALEELKLLIASADAQVSACVTGRRQVPDAATYVGKGKAEEIRAAVEEHQADLVVVNHAISPIQERNLERIVKCRVVDRTGLILDIFAQRASSREGKLQVELAQLRHLSTRLVRGWTHLERQKGGIGLRGPGETQLETDRRLIGGRIKTLKKRLQKVKTQRGMRRKARGKVPIPTVSLVGYTNAGKSSLFNRMTRAGVFAADQLFATLDPTMRRIQVPDCGELILADTVGFIRHLPHDLIEAFHSTLEEVSSAALLLHVVDAADADRQQYIAQVEEVLEEIGASRVPVIQVFNKIDLLERPASFARDEQGRITRVWISAHTGEGVELLLQAISEHFRQGRLTRHLLLAPSAGRLRAQIYRRLTVIEEHLSDAGGWRLTVELEPAQLAWLEKQGGDELQIEAEREAEILARYGTSP